MTALDRYMDRNRANWDERVAIHRRNETGFYGIDRIRAGEDILSPIEAAEIGDLAGKRLLHLQCHFGLDTLCLVRRGADVTGLDFSPAAIAAARELADELTIPASFVEGNVYDALDLIDGTFDVVYSTWGTICWLPDTARWAALVAGFLRPGGFLYLADGHPIIGMLEEEDGTLVFMYPWRSSPEEPLSFQEPVTYTGAPDILANRETFEWNHPISSTLGSLLAAGLRLEWLHEHERLPWRHVPMMVEAGDGMYRLPDGHTPIPLAFSLRATRPT